MQGKLGPGEATEIVLTMWVDGGQEGSAMLLTTKAAGKLDAILVLRVEDGNDIFCSINGQYLPSFFGLPLTLLAALPRSAPFLAPTELHIEVCHPVELLDICLWNQLPSPRRADYRLSRC